MIWFNRTQLLQTKWDPYFIAIVINDVIDQRSENKVLISILFLWHRVYQAWFLLTWRELYKYNNCITFKFSLVETWVLMVTHESDFWDFPHPSWLALTSIWKLPSRWTWICWSHGSQDVVDVEDHGGDSQKEEFAAQPLGPRACVPREQFWKETNGWEWKYEIQMTNKWLLCWATKCVW